MSKHDLTGLPEQRGGLLRRTSEVVKDIVAVAFAPDPLLEPSERWKRKHDPARAIGAHAVPPEAVVTQLPAPRDTEPQLPRTVASGE
jgi:hypothetical protein